ncbi:hypothetical protein SDJN03_04138, partial [Cucurbita argyrosperma subsp. sororia]
MLSELNYSQIGQNSNSYRELSHLTQRGSGKIVDKLKIQGRYCRTIVKLIDHLSASPSSSIRFLDRLSPGNFGFLSSLIGC